MPHAVRVIKGPSTSVLTEADDEARHDETSTDKESEPEQEVSINHPHPNAPQPVYPNMYVSYIKGPKWTGWSMMHYTIECELTALPRMPELKESYHVVL